MSKKSKAQLENEAMASARFRGHKMTPFARIYERPNLSESVCEKCEMFVQVNTNPTPNQVHVGGTAVALNCSGSGE